MHPILAKLLSDGPVLLDGAWATELQACALETGACADAWNVKRPDMVAEVARAYVEAGSKVILTNTFGANRANLAGWGLAEMRIDINRSGVEIAKRVAGASVLVFGSIGPLNVRGTAYSPSARDEIAVLAEQADILSEGGVDGIVLETFPSPAAVARILPAIRHLDVPIVAGMNLPNRWRDTHTLDSLRNLIDLGADAVGTNCGCGPEQFGDFVRAVRLHLSVPIWIKPNAGLPDMSTGRPAYTLTPDEFAETAVNIVDLGADLIGGCCGMGPAHIQALADSLDRRHCERDERICATTR